MTNTVVTVRPAPPGERDEVRNLLRAAYQEYAAAVPPQVHQVYLAELLDLDRGGAPTTLVALLAGRIVGTARLYPVGGAKVPLPADDRLVALAYQIDLPDVDLPDSDDTVEVTR